MEKLYDAACLKILLPSETHSGAATQDYLSSISENQRVKGRGHHIERRANVKDQRLLS